MFRLSSGSWHHSYWRKEKKQFCHCVWLVSKARIGWQYRIENKAAIALQCKLNVKLIADFVLYSIWEDNLILREKDSSCQSNMSLFVSNNAINCMRKAVIHREHIYLLFSAFYFKHYGTILKIIPNSCHFKCWQNK